MSYTTSGLHHMTAITSDAQRNVDFYTGVLGLRLVKVTVNFDDPSSYHFYYGDTRGTPGTILTFFSWPGANRARDGRGVVEVTHLRVPTGALPWWEARLSDAGVETTANNGGLQFADFDGLRYELLEEDVPERVQPWTAVVPPAYAIGGMKGVTLQVGALAPTAAVLESELGFEKQDDRVFVARNSGDFVRLETAPTAPRALTGSGGVHHIAFRSQSESEQREWMHDLAAVNLRVSPVMDRDYFRSIYFREPGGVLFEIATDEPGFTVDEPLESLGRSLQLPAQYEPHRTQIEAALAPIRLPEVIR